MLLRKEVLFEMLLQEEVLLLPVGDASSEGGALSGGTSSAEGRATWRHLG